MIKDKVIITMLDFFPMLHRKIFKELREKKVGNHDFKILHTILCNDCKPMNYYCEKLLISKPNFTKASNRLIENKLLTREKNENDRRVIKLCITEEGKEVIIKIRKEMVNVLKERLSPLSEVDLELLLTSFNTIENIFNKLDE